MSDPRFTDPPQTDERYDPALRHNESGGMWGWVAGIAVLALIAFILVAGWNSNSNTASNSAPPTTTGTAPMRNLTPQSTTGSGAMSPSPATPSPATPAPPPSGQK